MSRVRVTCLANGDQIYEWSQQFFLKSLLTCILEIFVFKHLLLYILGFYIKKKVQINGQNFLKLELFSLLIYFKMRKKQCELIVEKFVQTVYICSKLPK